MASQPLLTNQPSSISQPSLTNQPSLASQTSLTNQPAIFSQPSLTNQPSVVSQPSFPQPVYVNPPQAPLGFANQPWLPQTVSQPVHTVVCVAQSLPNQAQALASGTLPVLPQSVSYQSGEADPIPLFTYNDHDIFISEVTRNKIWNGEYVELALLLKQNFSSTQCVSGTLAIIDNQLSIKPATSKIKQPINSIEMWSDAFINFILVYIQKHIAKASVLLRYMAVIRGATTQSANGLSMTCSSDYVPVKTQIGHGHKLMVICGCHVVCQVIFPQRVKGMRHVMNITLKVLVHGCCVIMRMFV